MPVEKVDCSVSDPIHKDVDPRKLREIVDPDPTMDRRKFQLFYIICFNQKYYTHNHNFCCYALAFNSYMYTNQKCDLYKKKNMIFL